MQAFLRALNIILSPVLTLYFASMFGGLTIAGKAAGELVGAAAAGLLVLAVEIALSQGPKHSAWLRRWLDPRAAFEGVWFQDVFEGQNDNRIGIFSLVYVREANAFAVLGHAYAANGRRWAIWESTHMFIDPVRCKAVYLWEGEVLIGPTPEPEKKGLTELQLQPAPALSLPMTGEGRVSHLGEVTRVKFRLHRVTHDKLRALGLPFGVRRLRIDEHDEEAQLAAALLKVARLVPSTSPAGSTSTTVE